MEIRSIVEVSNASHRWLSGCKRALGEGYHTQHPQWSRHMDRNFFWRVILRVPESCPKVALRCETKMLQIEWRVWQEKVFLLMRIRNHEEDVLCRQIFEEAKARGWPGPGQEVSDICQTLNIPDVNHEFVPKSKIKEAVFNHHYR
jgi:hypothetical protein